MTETVYFFNNSPLAWMTSWPRDSQNHWIKIRNVRTAVTAVWSVVACEPCNAAEAHVTQLKRMWRWWCPPQVRLLQHHVSAGPQGRPRVRVHWAPAQVDWKKRVELDQANAHGSDGMSWHGSTATWADRCWWVYNLQSTPTSGSNTLPAGAALVLQGGFVSWHTLGYRC